MSSRQFVFVNKDSQSSSLIRHSVEEQNLIASHVQRGRRHHRPGRKVRQRKTASKSDARPTTDEIDARHQEPIRTSSSSTSSASNTGEFKQFVLKFENGRQLLTPASVSPHPSSESDRGSDAPDTALGNSDDMTILASPHTKSSPVQEHRPKKLTGLPHDISQIAINPIDPFAETCVPIDSRVLHLLQYYQTWFHPGIWHTELLASGHSSYAFQTSAAEILRNAFRSSVDLYAMLAAVSSRLENIHLLPDQNIDFFLSKALVATRRHILQLAQHDTKSNEQILMIIFHLHVAESYRGNSYAARVHLQGALKVVNSFGGLKYVKDSHIRELIYIIDGHFSAWNYEPCKFPCDYDPGPYLTAIPPQMQIKRPTDSNSWAKGLLACRGHGLISDEMCDIVSEIAECTWVLQHAREAPIEASRHAMRWFNVRQRAIRHHLYALNLVDYRADALRKILTLWMYITMTFAGPKMFCKAIGQKLRHVLMMAAQNNLTWKDHEDVHRWILSVCAAATGLDRAEETWFVGQLAATYTHADFGCYRWTNVSVPTIFECLTQLQKQFFYHEIVQRPLLQALAEKFHDYINLPVSST